MLFNCILFYSFYLFFNSYEYYYFNGVRRSFDAFVVTVQLVDMTSVADGNKLPFFRSILMMALSVKNFFFLILDSCSFFSLINYFTLLISSYMFG